MARLSLALEGTSSSFWQLPCMPGTLCHLALMALAASCGVGTARLQRPSLRAGATTRHPMLSASCDDNWKAWRRRPHLSDGFFEGPGSLTGRLHQHPGRSLTQHRNTAYAAL